MATARTNRTTTCAIARWPSDRAATTSGDIAAEGGNRAGGRYCYGVEGEKKRTGGGGEQRLRVESGDRGCGRARGEAADVGHEVDEQVLDEEEPEEDGDERCDLVAQERAEAEAERCPQRRGGDPARWHQGVVAAVERDRDSTRRERGAADA